MDFLDIKKLQLSILSKEDQAKLDYLVQYQKNLELKAKYDDIFNTLFKGVENVNAGYLTREQCKLLVFTRDNSQPDEKFAKAFNDGQNVFEYRIQELECDCDYIEKDRGDCTCEPEYKHSLLTRNGAKVEDPSSLWTIGQLQQLFIAVNGYPLLLDSSTE